MDFVSGILYLLKYVFFAYATVRVIRFLHIMFKSILIHFVWPKYNLNHLKDSWTVVTGGTDGIGKAYTIELAKTRGMRKFYLIGRNPKKLDSVKQELESKYEAEVRTAIFDFESSEYSKLPDDLGTIDVGILVNCAGMAPAQVGNLVEQEDGLPSKILQVNLMSAIKIIEIILPGMVKRDKGCVVNVSSITGWRPLPYLSTYPASKAALAFYSDALYDEFKNTNLKIQCLIPLLVATNLASYDVNEANNIMLVTPETFARQAVNAIGHWGLITGCIQHDIQLALGALVSFSFFKIFYVPFVLLGEHKDRVTEFQKNLKDKSQ